LGIFLGWLLLSTLKKRLGWWKNMLKLSSFKINLNLKGDMTDIKSTDSGQWVCSLNDRF
jgi:hypothetical protein